MNKKAKIPLLLVIYILCFIFYTTKVDWMSGDAQWFSKVDSSPISFVIKRYETWSSRKMKKRITFSLIVLVLLIVGALGFILITNNRSNSTNESTKKQVFHHLKKWKEKRLTRFKKV
ncbi:potassium uptake protein, TrkH family [Lactococcus cremoris]|nr:potassium uptake protein, TrkH family [Lactococcus cremoris]